MERFTRKDRELAHAMGIDTGQYDVGAPIPISEWPDEAVDRLIRDVLAEDPTTAPTIIDERDGYRNRYHQALARIERITARRRQDVLMGLILGIGTASAVIGMYQWGMPW